MCLSIYDIRHFLSGSLKYSGTVELHSKSQWSNNWSRNAINDMSDMLWKLTPPKEWLTLQQNNGMMFTAVFNWCRISQPWTVVLLLLFPIWYSHEYIPIISHYIPVWSHHIPTRIPTTFSLHSHYVLHP